MKGSRYISLLLLTAMVLGPSVTFAQGFDFGAGGEEEEEEVVEQTTSDNGDSNVEIGAADEGGLTFDTDDVARPKDDDERAVVAVVALPGPLMTPSLRKDIEAKMNEVLKDIPSNVYVGSGNIVDALQSRGMLECVQEPICLGAVGTNNGVDQILIAQVTATPTGGQTLTIDLFEAKDKLTLKYAKEQGLRTNGAILDAIKPLLYNIFDVREKRQQNFTSDKSSLVSPIVAWTSLGLALGAAGAGGYFTYAAYKGDTDLKNKIANKDITQRDAEKANEAVKQKQTTSFIFYGLAAGLAAVSITFFVLDVGGDVSNDQEASIHNLKLAPVFSTDGAGMTAGFNF